MGAGDVRTRRGKIANGSYGNSRKHKAAKPAATAKTPGRPKAK